MPLTATIITKDEARHIEAAVASVAWADEVLVVDSGSADGTAALAERAGARVIVRDWPGYATQKNFAAGEAQHDWILSIDADERVTPGLEAEIRSTLASSADVAGYRIPRVTWHLGRWWRTTDWYPDYQLRLYNRQRARWKERRVHEAVEANGPVGVLRRELQHYAYRDISHHLATMDRYTTLAAEDLYESGRRAGVFDLVAHPPAAFLRNYVVRGGVTQGAAGLIVSAMNAHYVFLKFAKLWARQQRSSDPNR